MVNNLNVTLKYMLILFMFFSIQEGNVFAKSSVLDLRCVELANNQMAKKFNSGHLESGLVVNAPMDQKPGTIIKDRVITLQFGPNDTIRKIVTKTLLAGSVEPVTDTYLPKKNGNIDVTIYSAVNKWTTFSWNLGMVGDSKILVENETTFFGEKGPFRLVSRVYECK